MINDISRFCSFVVYAELISVDCLVEKKISSYIVIKIKKIYKAILIASNFEMFHCLEQ